MRKVSVICSFVFLLMLGFEGNVDAQNEIQAHITMYESVSSAGESYAFKLEMSGQPAKDVSRVLIQTPNHRKLSFHNNLKFDTFLFSRDGMTFTEFKKRFPEGPYEIDLTPKRYGRFKINMIYNFPNVVITSPVEGQTGLSLDPLIEWEPLTNISNLSLIARSTSHTFSTSLPIDASSFTAGYDYLMPNTQYELSLEATTTDFEGNALVRTYTVSIKTIAQ